MSVNNEQFNAILPLISADLVSVISEKRGIEEQKAMQSLYDSKLYEALEDEQTKLWQYSTPMLYSIFEQQEKGIFEYPDT